MVVRVFFVKSAICSHLLGWDILEGLGLFEFKADPSTFVIQKKRGPKKYIAVINKIGKALKKE